MSILCLESGGSKLVAARSDSRGRLQEVRIAYRRRDQKALETLQTLCRLGRELLDPSSPFQAVSFGFGGTVCRAQRRPRHCFHEEGWEEVHGREYLEGAFPVPVFVENDCKLAALGEAHWEDPRPRGTLFYVTLGTGVGGGIVRDGLLLELGREGEAELGHVVVEEEGIPCPCGNRGCLETVCSGPGLSSLAQRRIGTALQAPELMRRFRQGDPQACRVVEEAAGHLARVLASVINLLHPDQIVLGGGVMKENPLFLERVQEQLRPFVFPVFAGRTRLLLSRLEENVVCQGAAIYALQKLSLWPSPLEKEKKF